jgi:hypothetical protein
MKTNRDTIIFYLPISMDSLTRDISPVSVAPPIISKSSNIADTSSTNSGGKDNVFWEKKRLYLNPSEFRVNEVKIIKDTLTKGGYSVQYWGEQLTTIDINGTTGSSGIEGINVLYSIYRHEQLHYPSVLEDRDRRLAKEALDQAVNNGSSSQNSSLVNALTIADTILTGGEISETIRGVSSTINSFKDLIQNGGSDYTPTVSPSIPTLAAFATNIQMYHDGVFYRGYFGNFSFSENAESPGYFTYNFQYKVTRKYGERKNFMPWHRNPLDIDGNTIPAQTPQVSKGTYPGVNRLSYPLDPVEGRAAWSQKSYTDSYRDENSGIFSGQKEQNSTFIDDNPTSPNISVSRRKLITG